MRRFQKFLSLAAASRLVARMVAVVVLAVGASGGVALAQAGAATPGSGWPQLHYGPDRTG